MVWLYKDDKYHQYIFCYVLNIDNDSYIFYKEKIMDIDGKNIIYRG